MLGQDPQLVHPTHQQAGEGGRGRHQAIYGPQPGAHSSQRVNFGLGSRCFRGVDHKWLCVTLGITGKKCIFGRKI